MSRKSAGFTLIEVLVVISVVAMLISLILPAISKARKTARTMLCLANMEQLSVANGSYAVTFQNRLPSYTWGPGHMESRWADLRNPRSYLEAVGFQAIDIMRRRADREDLGAMRDRFPQRHYTHLVMLDFIGEKIPTRLVACPEDRVLLNWQKSPRNPDPVPGGGDGWNHQPYGRLWPYASSYQTIPATWAPDRIVGNVPTISQYLPNHNLFTGGGNGTMLGRRRASDVAFPSSKVLYFDFFSRHRGRLNMFYAYPEAIVSLLFFDGSARLRMTADANEGFQPNNPASPNPSFVQYRAEITGWEPPTPTGNSFDTLKCWYRWTRGGLRGIDFGSKEIGTGQPPK